MSHLGIIRGDTESAEERCDRQSFQSTDIKEGASQPSNSGQPAEEYRFSRRKVIAGIGLIGTVGLAGCSGSDGGGEEESAVRDVIQRQEEALENNDLDRYMETMHPESPIYDRTRSATAQLLQNYDLRLDIEINSVSIDGDTATAETTQETRIEESDPSFQENRAEITHELRTYEGEWRVYNSSIDSTEPL